MSNFWFDYFPSIIFSSYLETLLSLQVHLFRQFIIDLECSCWNHGSKIKILTYMEWASRIFSHTLYNRKLGRCNMCLWIRQRKPLTPPPQGSTQIRRRDDVESWGVYFQGLVNLDLINFLTMWIFTLCEIRPGESWTNAVYISSENVLITKIDCSKNVLLIVVLVEYKLKWMCC